MIHFKYCDSQVFKKNGYVRGKQRYFCKTCHRNYILGDARVKYTQVDKIRVIRLYLEGSGIRSIERLESIPHSLIIQWIRECANALRATLQEQLAGSKHAKKIELLELDELFSYCKKN